MPGYGTVLGWIFDRLPTKREGLLNEQTKLEREQDEIRKKPQTDSNTKRMEFIAQRLRIIKEKIATIKS